MNSQQNASQANFEDNSSLRKDEKYNFQDRNTSFKEMCSPESGTLGKFTLFIKILAKGFHFRSSMDSLDKKPAFDSKRTVSSSKNKNNLRINISECTPKYK